MEALKFVIHLRMVIKARLESVGAMQSLSCVWMIAVHLGDIQ